jgi:hypothetical protein
MPYFVKRILRDLLVHEPWSIPVPPFHILSLTLATFNLLLELSSLDFCIAIS